MFPEPGFDGLRTDTASPGIQCSQEAFDDGPSNLTPKVLDLLDQYDAKATFFVVCKNNEEYEEYLSEIVKRGHTLALHSYSHDYNKIYASKDAFLKDYQQVFDWVVENANYTPSLFQFFSTSGRAARVAFFPLPSCISTTGVSTCPILLQILSMMFEVVVRLLPSPELTFQSKYWNPLAERFSVCDDIF